MNQNKIFFLSNNIDPAIISFFSSAGYKVSKVKEINKNLPILFNNFDNDIFYGSKLESSISKLCDDYPYSKYIIPTDGSSPSNQSLRRMLTFFFPQKFNVISNLISRSLIDEEKKGDGFDSFNNNTVMTFSENKENFIKFFLNFIQVEPVYDFREISVTNSID